MKQQSSKRIKLVFVGVMAAFVVSGVSARADFTFGEPTNLGPTVNSGWEEINPRLTDDGLELYFMSIPVVDGRPSDIWYTTRTSLSEPWRERQPAPLPTDETEDYHSPDITENGLSLYVCSWQKTDRYGAGDIYLATRAMRSDSWSEPTNLGPSINTTYSENCPFLTADGLSLYFSGDPWLGLAPQIQRPGGLGSADIWITNKQITEQIPEGYWSEPRNLGPVVNSSSMDASPCVTADGRILLFHSDRPGGSGSLDLWMAHRDSRDDDWGVPQNLGPTVNSTSEDLAPEVSPDGSVLLFTSLRPGGQGRYDIWQAPIIPIVDLNSDGIVDSNDMCIMVDHWGTDDSLCDIGPMPWGDGIVDVEDLKVLAEHLFEEFTPAQ